jgi:hypothetical protein
VDGGRLLSLPGGDAMRPMQSHLKTLAGRLQSAS